MTGITKDAIDAVIDLMIEYDWIQPDYHVDHAKCERCGALHGATDDYRANTRNEVEAFLLLAREKDAG